MFGVSMTSWLWRCTPVKLNFDKVVLFVSKEVWLTYHCCAWHNIISCMERTRTLLQWQDMLWVLFLIPEWHTHFLYVCFHFKILAVNLWVPMNTITLRVIHCHHQAVSFSFDKLPSGPKKWEHPAFLCIHYHILLKSTLKEYRKVVEHFQQVNNVSILT